MNVVQYSNYERFIRSLFCKENRTVIVEFPVRGQMFRKAERYEKTAAFVDLYTGNYIIKIQELYDHLAIIFEAENAILDHSWNVKLELSILLENDVHDSVVFMITNEKTMTKLMFWKMSFVRRYRENFVSLDITLKVLEEQGLQKEELKKNLAETVKHSDMLLKMSFQSIETTKQMLSSYSKMFNRVFNEDLQQSSFEIRNTTFKEMVMFIGIMYGFKPKIGYKVYKSMFGLCDYFEAPVIKDVLIKNLNKLDNHYLVPFLLLAQKYNSIKLQEKVVGLINTLQQLKDVIRNKNFDEITEINRNYIMKSSILRIQIKF